ncbi:lysogenization regulator [Psychromonas sp. CNPT3]|uniref:high frequency lysogenization protein HflD n=1 Tax=Psychromonas sp. CNPT3 TaxID=314282 RepID=UPI00006E9CD7|nr:high frequency lysogenization protein HflD [Psychromonas sp. CNPT3]AGH81906.1 lysogenization regulator [Psychromonas sp. CNPT3]
MSYHDLPSRCIAFAAMCQAAYLVDKLACTGNVSNLNAFDASLLSILRVDSNSPLDVFGGYSSLEVGLKSMQDQLNGSTKGRNMQVTKYIIGMLALEKKLTEDPSVGAQLGARINQIQHQLADANIDDDNILNNLNLIYKDLISDLGPKIQVNGSPSCLQQERTQHKIRALLLAGVRAAVLWRQIGGKRRQLIFSRKAMLHQTEQNLRRI